MWRSHVSLVRTLIVPSMSYIQSTIECADCKHQMNVEFGVIGTTLQWSWPKKCPKCGCEKLVKIAEGWHANNEPTS